MKLRNVSLDDLDLYIALRCDPEMMAEIGGPQPIGDMPDKVRRDAEATARDDAWILTIIPDEATGESAGGVVIWESDLDGEPINEIGWMVLKRFQGRGIASEAIRLMLLRAQAEQRWDRVHAFPAVTNRPSNALCRKLGFELIGQHDGEFAGTPIHSNHWRLDITTWNPNAASFLKAP